MVEVLESHVVARRLQGGGFSFTLTTRLAEILRRAETQFGTRNKDFTILGVEFREGVPQIWFPHDSEFVAVQLSRQTLNDNQLALFQLAHEAIHLLDCCQTATVLEEGVATRFQQEYTREIFRLNEDYPTCNYKYDAARALVDRLVGVAPNAVRTLRLTLGSFGEITAESIAELDENLESIAEMLVMPFSEFNPPATI